MKAVTHTEIYRPFEGELRPHPLRFWPLVAAGVRNATRKKLPLLLLYGPPAIATIIFSFIVYGVYAVESAVDGISQGKGGGFQPEEMLANIAIARAQQFAQVKNLIVVFHQIMVWFALLGTSWYGCGLFADDRRVGAHQLYFSRPLTRLDYFLGKFLIVATFASFSLLLPGVVLCLMASFTSPEWAFLKEEWDVILETLAYSSIWVTFASLAVLAASSLASKRVFALVGMFAIFAVTFPFGAMLGEVVNEECFAIGPIWSIWKVGTELFDADTGTPGPSLATAVQALVAYVVVFLGVIWWRLRKLEVVA